jgi:hypothetical protein
MDISGGSEEVQRAAAFIVVVLINSIASVCAADLFGRKADTCNVVFAVWFDEKC